MVSNWNGKDTFLKLSCDICGARYSCIKQSFFVGSNISKIHQMELFNCLSYHYFHVVVVVVVYVSRF